MAQLLTRSKVRIFESALEKIARILADKYKIKVIFKHDTCMTDGRTIYLPIIPDNASEEFLGAVQGFLDHEVGHLIYSDFRAIKKLERKNRKQWNVFQVLEDGRIEAAMRKLWRGSGVNLNRCNDWALKQLKERWDELSDFGKFCQGCAVLGCDGPDHWFVKEVLKPDQELWEKLRKVRSLIEDTKALPDSASVIKQSAKLLEKLGETEDDEPEGDSEEGESGQQQGERRRGKRSGDPQAGPSGGESEDFEDDDDDFDEDEDDDSESEGSRSGSGSGDGDEDEDEEGEGGSGTTDDDDDEDEEGEPYRTGLPDRRARNSDFDVNDQQMHNDEQIRSRHNMIRDAARAEFAAEDRYLIYTTEGDVVERIVDGDKLKALQFMRESRALVNVLYKKMRLNLLSVSQSRWEPDKRRGKVNPKAVFRVSMGTSKRVFRKRVEAPGFNTRVLLLVDHSGSMAGYKINLGAKTAMLLGEVLSELDIPFEIWGYSTTDYDMGRERYQRAKSEEQEVYTRWGNLWVGIYKDFDEDWRTTKHRCYQMSRNQKCNTYDGEAIRMAAARLLQFPEHRKVLFMINDGCPCPNVGSKIEEHTRYAKEMAQEIEKLIEMFAIGICSHGIGDIYSNAVEINSVEDLPKVMLSQLDAMLRQGKSLIQRRRAS